MTLPSPFYWNQFFKKRTEGRCADLGRDLEKCPADMVARKVLEPCYGGGLKIGGCESTMSLASRPDPIFAVFRRRALRELFVFQDVGAPSGKPVLVGALNVRCMSPDDERIIHKGRDVEWLDYTCSAYMRPPAYMTPDRGYYLPLLSCYSVNSGLLPFDCLPYLSHNPFFGYVCAQAAVYLSLEIMMSLGAVPHSPAALSHVAADMNENCILKCYDEKQDTNDLCEKHNREIDVKDGGYFAKGFCQDDLINLLDTLLPGRYPGREKPRMFGTRALHVVAERFGKNLEDTIFIHVETMLSAGIPVIAWVEYQTLAQVVGALDSSLAPTRHVTTIIGLRDPVHGEREVVFHDGHLGPYRTIPLSGLIAAAEAAHMNQRGDDDQDGEGRVHLFSALPASLDPEVYRDVLTGVRVASHGSRWWNSCKIRLVKRKGFSNYLLAWLPGDLADAPPYSKLFEECDIKDDPYLWVVEYSSVGLSQESGDGNIVLLDLIRAAPKHGQSQRIGVMRIHQRSKKPPTHKAASSRDWKRAKYPVALCALEALNSENKHA